MNKRKLVKHFKDYKRKWKMIIKETGVKKEGKKHLDWKSVVQKGQYIKGKFMMPHKRI